ncbi:MAG TPA: hypothetical protein DHV36_11700 [Desulfobacteraceae bacterium]|nr:hypothetical protein [Desulfobacteraceae bacterium]
MEIQLLVQTGNRVRPRAFGVEQMINAGFTGRNQEEVRHHLDELAAKGIEVPGETPVLYPVVPCALTAKDTINVYGTETSGEIEYILFVESREEIFVGIGSDHTDRKLEELDIPRAKQITPNVFAPVVWPLAEVESHWDRLIMGCDVTLDGEQVVYQEGELALLMSPAELMALVKEKVNGSLDGAVIYSGTVKMETEEFVFADRFEGRLEDPVLGRAISFGYDIRPIPALG